MSYSIGFDAADQCDRVADDMAREDAWLEYVEEMMGSYLMETQEGFSIVMEEIICDPDNIQKLEEILFFLASKPIRDMDHRYLRSTEILVLIENTVQSIIERNWDRLCETLRKNNWLDA